MGNYLYFYRGSGQFLPRNKHPLYQIFVPDMPEQRIPLAAAADVGAAGFFDRVGAGFRHLF